MDRKLIGFVFFLSASAFAATPEQISVKHGTHTFVNGNSGWTAISGDGNLIAFESVARLTPDDKNKTSDLYLYNRSTCILRRITTADPFRTNGNPSISRDGCTLAFQSYAKWSVKMKVPRTSDLVFQEIEGGTQSNIFLSDLLNQSFDGETIAPVLGPDGQLVLFTSNSTQLTNHKLTGIPQIYLFDRTKNKIFLISQTSQNEPVNRLCGHARMSQDGAVVAYLSAATNLEPALSPTSLAFHLYINDRTAQTTIRVDVFEKGFDSHEWIVGAFDMDASGSVLVFQARHRIPTDPIDSLRSTDLFLYDRVTDKINLLTTGIFSNNCRMPTLSADGRYLAFVFGGDKSKKEPSGLVVYDRNKDVWSRVADGPCDNPKISKDGRFIVYEKEVKNFRNVFVVENSAAENP